MKWWELLGPRDIPFITIGDTGGVNIELPGFIACKITFSETHDKQRTISAHNAIQLSHAGSADAAQTSNLPGLVGLQSGVEKGCISVVGCNHSSQLLPQDMSVQNPPLTNFPSLQ